jgi:hypothetical protein
MEVALAALADRAQSGPSGLCLDGVITSLLAPDFPHTSRPLCIGCVFSFGESERLEQAFITADLIDPDGRSVSRLMHYEAIVAGAIGDPFAMHVAMNIGRLELVAPGDYQLRIEIDHQLKHLSDLRVSHQSST